jgi:hypothetical protein
MGLYRRDGGTSYKDTNGMKFAGSYLEVFQAGCTCTTYPSADLYTVIPNFHSSNFLSFDRNVDSVNCVKTSLAKRIF